MQFSDILKMFKITGNQDSLCQEIRISSQMVNQDIGVDKIFHRLNSKNRYSSLPALPGRLFVRSPFGESFAKDASCILHNSFDGMFYWFSQIGLQEFPFNGLKFFFQIFNLSGKFKINHNLFSPYLRKCSTLSIKCQGGYK
mgnify:CR=1 FL=1